MLLSPFCRGPLNGDHSLCIHCFFHKPWGHQCFSATPPLAQLEPSSGFRCHLEPAGSPLLVSHTLTCSANMGTKAEKETGMPQDPATSKLAEMRSQIRSPYDKPAPALLSNSGQCSVGSRDMECIDILSAWRTLSLEDAKW